MTGPFPLLTFVLVTRPFAAAVVAPSTALPGRDLMLIDTWNLPQFQRVGNYPTGYGSMGESTTVCNIGTAAIPFVSAMNPEHAFIHYMICRESGGRVVE